MPRRVQPFSPGLLEEVPNRRRANRGIGGILLTRPAARAAVAAALAFLLCSANRGAGQGRGDDFQSARHKMVDDEIVAAGVLNPRVVESMRNTPRHEFVATPDRKNAYLDMALPIGAGQTISPPFVVAYMTEQLDPQPGDRVLEIGTGSGYQAAVLSPLVKEVYSIEIVDSLGRKAAQALKRLRYDNVFTKVGDGYEGWPEHAPFDKIIVTCSPEKVPQPLVDQLAEGGRIVIPVGERYEQTLYLYTKKDGRLTAEALLPTLFVPMTGEAEAGRQVQPDPLNPRLENGSFEEILEGTESPRAWHYQRQLQLTTGDGAPDGERYAKFRNLEPSRGAQALQGLAIDGRAIQEIDLSCWVRVAGVGQGGDASPGGSLAISFYDQQRKTVGDHGLGPWRGTFDWRVLSVRIPVPIRAREAIVRIGLFGAVGELDLDAVELKVIRRRSTP